MNKLPNPNPPNYGSSWRIVTEAEAELRNLKFIVEALTARVLKVEAALEVEQAKVALLWPVATGQPSIPTNF